MTTTITTLHREYFYEIVVNFDTKEVETVVRFRKHRPEASGESVQYHELDEQTKDHLRPLIRKAYADTRDDDRNAS